MPGLSGKAAKSFITELTFWLDHFNKNSEYQYYIALKVYFILPSLLLQKPSKKSKSKDHCRKLEERMNTWKEGRIRDLVREGRNIQQKITTSNQRSSEDKAKTFAKLMLQGKVNAALKLLSIDYDNGVHQINDDIINQLQQKHPIPRPIDDNILLHGPIDRILPSYFENIDEGTISKAARLTKCAAGPSQLDAYLYRHIKQHMQHFVMVKSINIHIYFMRTIPNIENYLKPLDEVITKKFIPSLLESISTEEERELYSLPIRLGGLGIPIISETASEH